MSKQFKHIHPIFEQLMQRGEKENFLNQNAKVIWLTGLSGSGKSTIAKGLESVFFNKGYFVQVLDGDNIRMGISNNLGFSEEDRTENIRMSFSMHVYDTDWTPIESIENENFTFNLFPNPADNLLQIEYNLDRKQDLEFFIFNNIGQLVYQNKLLSTKQESLTVDVSTFSEGVYFVKLKTKDSAQFKKVIIN